MHCSNIFLFADNSSGGNENTSLIAEATSVAPVLTTASNLTEMQSTGSAASHLDGVDPVDNEAELDSELDFDRQECSVQEYEIMKVGGTRGK